MTVECINATPTDCKTKHDQLHYTNIKPSFKRSVYLISCLWSWRAGEYPSMHEALLCIYNRTPAAALLTSPWDFLSSGSHTCTRTHSPPEHACFAVFISELLLLTFNQWEESEMSGEVSAISIIWAKGSKQNSDISSGSAPARISYVWNNVRPKLHSLSCLKKAFGNHEAVATFFFGSLEESNCGKYHAQMEKKIKIDDSIIVVMQIMCSHFENGMISARSPEFKGLIVVNR